MDVTQRLATELTRLNRFSNGRRLFVLKKVLELAIAINLPGVVATAEWALAHERSTRKLERRWRTVRRQRAKGRGNAREVDIQLDRVIGAMLDSVRALLVTLDPASEHAAKARAFIDTYFPDGANAITNAEFEDALAIIEEMNEDFATYSEQDLSDLNIKFHVQELARLLPLFAAALNQPANPDEFRFEQLREARAEGHERLCELVAEIVGATRGRDTPEKLQQRAMLLAPIIEANERVAERRRRKNAPDVEVDPNTGEELEEGADLVDEVDTSLGGASQDGSNA